VKTVGFDLSPYNDIVMVRMIHNAISIHTVLNWIKVGFHITDLVIKRTLAVGKPYIFYILEYLVDKDRLYLLARHTIFELFGPYLDHKTSLNVAWNGSAVQRIIRHFKITDSELETAV
jgi:hypothetical protein